MSAYTEGEVAWLLGLTEGEAIASDGPRSALHDADAGSSEAQVPTIARWLDVQRAKRIVLGSRKVDAAAIAAAETVSQGTTQAEAAVQLGVSQRTVGRKTRSVVEAIVDELGMMDPPPPGVRLVTFARAA